MPSTLLFLFYFNRFLAYILSFLIRLYTWHHYRVYVQIQALQVSPLAGRVFFKGVKYFGRNESILIQDGYITWRYWLLRVQDIGHGASVQRPDSENVRSSSGSDQDDNGDEEEAAAPLESARVPCRISAKARGVQWFIYNRSPAYDMILQSMTRSKELHEVNKNGQGLNRKSTEDTSIEEKSRSLNDTLQGEGMYHRTDTEYENSNKATARTSTKESAFSEKPQVTKLPSFLNILPIAVECGKAAVVMGNQSTKSILVAKIDGATGQFTAQPSQAADLYKQVINFNFEHPTIQFKQNKDYKDQIFVEGQKLCARNGQKLPKRKSWYGRLYREQGARRASEFLKEFLPHRRGSVDSLKRSHTKGRGKEEMLHDDLGAYGQSKWLGLTRYLDDEDDMVEQERWKSIEYAQLPQIVDCPSVSMSFYWDVPGLVARDFEMDEKFSQINDNINGDPSPEWGIELKVRGGSVNYGPWADRQRTDFQNVFFPPIHMDGRPVNHLPAGATRVNTELKIIVIFENQVTVRVPTREESKDWQWRHRVSSSNAGDANRKRKFHPKLWKTVKASQGPESRPFGWIDAKILPDSTISATIGMLARADGYFNGVDVDLKGLELSSSVNHTLFWRSQAQSISCNLSNPLRWNDLRQWHIALVDTGLELFMLRDHMFLLTDLINDWASGPLPDYFTFVPFEYALDLRFSALKLYINANDSNIIDNPCDMSENTYVMLCCPELDARLLIPMRHFRVSKNKVEFDANARDGSLELVTPSWNTQHTFLDSGDIATLKELKLSGSYNYFTTTSPTLTDTLYMDVFGSVLRLRLYGFLIRYFMNIKENYFGEDLHFRTSEEYQRQLQIPRGAGDESDNAEQHKRPSNDLDTILVIKAEKACAILPAQLYAASTGVKIEIFSVGADLRITNYYMDLAVTSSPVCLSQIQSCQTLSSLAEATPETQMCVQGVNVDGHRLFGLPPDEPTYVCKWAFDVGPIRGQMVIDFLRTFTLAVGCFALSLDDSENALSLIAKAVIHDVTFLRATIQSVHLALCIEDAVCLVSSHAIEVTFNDWAGSLFSDRLRAIITNLVVAITDSHNSSSSQSSLASMAETHAYIKTSVTIDQVSRALDFQQKRRLQQEHLLLQDARTNRVPWLKHVHDNSQSLPSGATGPKTRIPAMQYPQMPSPLSRNRSKAEQVTNETSSQNSSTSRQSRMSFMQEQTSNQRIRNFFHGKASLKTGSAERSPESSHRGVSTDQTHHNAHSSIGVMPQHNHRPKEKEPQTQRKTFERPSLAFSSPYKMPAFTLLTISPDTRRVPRVPDNLPGDGIFLESETIADYKTRIVGQDVEQTSLMISLLEGLQMFCTSKALMLLTHMMDEMQTYDLSSLLDNLHIEAVKEVLNVEGKRKRGLELTDLRFFAPYSAVRFSNVTGPASDASSEEQYDLTVNNLSLVARSSIAPQKDRNDEAEGDATFHMLVNELEFSAREASKNNAVEQAVVSLRVDKPMMWLLKGSTTSIELQLGDLVLTGTSRRVDYISSLLRQTALVAQDLADKFSRVAQKHRLRRQLFVLLLAEEGQSAPDPPFLSGASVLRSSTSHLRTSHSWRMVSRFRYIYMNLPSQSKEEMQTQCVQRWAACPKDAAKLVDSFFEQWRMWDMGDAASNLLMRKVYGQKYNGAITEKHLPLVLATIKARQIRFIIEPGMAQNELVLEHCLFGVSTRDQLSSRILRLNWSLCELVENIMETMQSSNLLEPNQSSPVVQTQDPAYAGLHIVASSKMSILNVDIINAKIVTVCKGLQTSILKTKPKSAQTRGSINLLLNATAVRTEAHEDSAQLYIYNLQRPHLFGCRRLARYGEIEKPWTFVGSGHQITLQTLKTPLELTEVIDKVIQEEVVHLAKWSRTLPRLKTPSSSTKAIRPSGGFPKAHVALFLDAYNINVAILPSLVYEISGHGIRLSLQSAALKSSVISVDIDLKEHAHTFRSDLDKRPSTISTLMIPPIQGYLKTKFQPRRNVVICRLTAEHISLNASSLHAVFDAVNQPAILELGKDLRHEAQLLQQHIDVVFHVNAPEAVAKEPSSVPLMFDAKALVSGVTVHALTPHSPSIPPTLEQAAEFKFDFGQLILQGTNIDPKTRSVMPMAEFKAQMDSIKLDLLRPEDLDFRNCGSLTLALMLTGTSKLKDNGTLVRSFEIRSSSLQIVIFTETASAALTILGHLQETLQTIELPAQVKDIRKLGRERLRREGLLPSAFHNAKKDEGYTIASDFSAMYSLIMEDIQIAWKIGNAIPVSPVREVEDLILSVQKVDLATKTDNAAKLIVEKLQLQVAPPAQAGGFRSSTSAFMPEVLFNVAYRSTRKDRRLAFQAVGKTLDLKFTSQSILPANDLRRSIAVATNQVREATDRYKMNKQSTGTNKATFLGNKKLASLLVHADFAGAIVQMQGKTIIDPASTAMHLIEARRRPQHGRYNQFIPQKSSNSSATLQAPGIALKVEFKDSDPSSKSLSAEMKVSASSNTLFPAVVPLIMELSSSIKEIVEEPNSATDPHPRRESKMLQSKLLEDDKLRAGDPSTLLGDCKLNLGLRICKQDFSLSCQPIARVAARARFDDIYITVNTAQSHQHGKFFTITGAFTGLEASVQHVYSRESTGNIKVDSVVVSLMNSRHVTAVNGISAILKLSPLKAQVNAKQLQDFLLFREIWIPQEIRGAPSDPSLNASSSEQGYMMQRYQQMAAAGSFPWNATISIEELDVSLDLGQSIGKPTFKVSEFWISSQKSSDWEQNLCVYFRNVGVESTGRTSGIINMQNLRVRTSIKWTNANATTSQPQTPLVQASAGFDFLRVKVSFDFQAFLVADLTNIDFLMYNVRGSEAEGRDRLVSVLKGDQVQAFCTTSSAAQAYALVQAFQRLIEEKQKAYEASLVDIERFLRRKSTLVPMSVRETLDRQQSKDEEQPKSPLRLQTDVVVTIKAVNLGAFPGVFTDTQVLKTEAIGTYSRFTVYLEQDRIHSTLSMTLGQLRVALSGVNRASRTLGDITIEEVITSATGAIGGTILKVPQLIATMQTWQDFGSTHIDYIFKSSFQGRVDVGWNYSRISYIRGMHANHVRKLAQRLGKPPPQSAVQITGLGAEGGGALKEGGQEKITAVVNVPQSKYQYTALQPPIIETPQLRDMGEATPPLEWIGLHRERLPTLTHQIVIVTLLEVAKEVDDAYSKILGSSGGDLVDH
ncbi:uncharacterized protein KY384_007431 [Bacidia gigantensis]|uniref:uncharacterized protein n=1 Tax=Bacidia gigantensis TaxID=2732470 RepID=UPI001D03A63E|nr:uncharacterized protein KY384_007431 [Bacidia gigantensis]KAG8528513.1 hypothetical protein KY384_007431 [Bacidia gigantensis]